VDLASVDASEEDKIQAAITQSTLDYDPAKYGFFFLFHHVTDCLYILIYLYLSKQSKEILFNFFLLIGYEQKLFYLLKYTF
jgi:hypothetical protein